MRRSELLRKLLRTVGVAAGALLVYGATPPAATEPLLATVDIDQVGYARLQQVKAEPGVAWWVELDDRLLVEASAAALATLGREQAVEVLPQRPTDGPLYLLRRAHRRDRQALTGGVVLAGGGRWAVVQASGATQPRLAHSDQSLRGAVVEPSGADLAAAPFSTAHGAALLPFQPNLDLARHAANAPPRAAPRQLAEATAAVVAQIDGNRWFADISTLAGWNRNTLNPGVLAARDWLVSELEALPGLQVTTQQFTVSGNPAFNVVATLPGSTRPDDWYIVGAHYDSTSQSPQTAAPGAEDNASGCAGVLELARALTHYPPEGTVLFICYSGEEQGLHGSAAHSAALVASGDSGKVRAMLNMDMIGYTGDADLDCLLETSSSHVFLVDALQAAAQQYTTLRIVTSFFPFGSDHVPYLNRGMPALLTIENDWDSYPAYHSTNDLPSWITVDMGYQVLRMNAAALAELAGAGAAELFTDGFESGDTSAWWLTVFD